MNDPKQLQSFETAHGLTNSALFRGNQIAAFFCLCAIVANQSIFRLGAMSPAWAVGTVLTIAALAILVPQLDLRMLPGAARPGVLNILLGLVILAPLFGHFVLGFDREFPFSGDSYFHVGQSYRVAYWWLSPVGSEITKVPTVEDVRRLFSHPISLVGSRLMVLLIVGAAVVFCYRLNRRAALIFAIVIFVGWGLFESTIFLRYPGARYLIDLPFLGPAFLANNLELGGRLASICAAIVWLFVLRPWLLGAWPDVRILPAAALLFWHKDVIYYFDSVYIEPWSFVFALLAVEILIVRGHSGAPAACLCIGAAACFKEPLIFTLPLVWLAGAPWSGSREKFVHVTGAAIAAGAPFVLYYAARKNTPLDDLGADRVLRLAWAPENWEQYASEFLRQLNFAFPTTSAFLAFFALLVAIVLSCSRGQTGLRWSILAGVALLALFMFDQASLRWAGYFRFLLYAIPFLAAGLIALGHLLTPRRAAVVAVTVMVLQAPSAYLALSRAAGAATERNFVEHYDSPLIFPMKSLVSEAIWARILLRGEPVLANLVDPNLRLLPGSPVAYAPSGELVCECNAAHPRVLALFVRFTNMSTQRAYTPAPPGSRLERWQNTNTQRPACLARMRQSCAHVLERIEGGEPVAVLGITPRAKPRN